MSDKSQVIQRSRRGMTLTELVVATAIATAAMVSSTQLMYQITRHYQRVADRQIVVQEVANVMEKVMSLPWVDLETSTAPVVELSPACQQAAPDARLQITVQQPDETLEARRITVTISCSPAGTSSAAPIQLVAWRYKS